MDEKKIEAIVDSNLGIVSKTVPDSPIFGYKDELRNLMVHCIKRGVELAFEDLWHPKDEEPQIGRMILVRFSDECCLGFKWTQHFYWEEYCKLDKTITGWLYVDDLLGQKGDDE